MQKVIISGADGFIGNHLARFIASKGVLVYAMVFEKTNLFNGSPNIVTVSGDLSQYESLVSQLPNDADAFFHLAWVGTAPEQRNSVDGQLKNIELSLNATRLSARCSARIFILPGSAMEYAYAGSTINASAKPDPGNAYAATKTAIQYLSAQLCKELGVPFIYTVISSIYAADRLDNNIINYTIRSLLKKEKPRLTKLEQLWDFVYIDDVVQALYLIAEYGRAGSFYTIGHGDNWPLVNYISMIQAIIDPSLPLGIGEIAYEEDRLPTSCVDLTALYKDTGFVPKIPFEVGIRQVISQLKSDLNIIS